ncbi:MAG: peptide chain release factor 1, partial [Chloroflexota bacterium]
SDPQVATDPQRLSGLAREHARLGQVVVKYREYKACSRSLEETSALLREATEPDMVTLAQEELAKLSQRQTSLLEELERSLTVAEPDAERDIIMEIRAGTGGQEAALFAGDLFRMYSRYAQRQGWPVELLHASPSDSGGLKEVILEIRGTGAYSRFKNESGVHRVQRVPVTESSGRLHTSTATVAVLAAAEEVEMEVKPEDIKIDTFTSSGPGGQNVNKVASAVRLTHVPTGIVVTCQEDRSQLRNRQRALVILRARLLDQERQRQQQAMTQERRSQVGGGERAEKIRTYNFPQDRVTDHRLGLSFHNLPQLLDGNLDELLDAMASGLAKQ